MKPSVAGSFRSIVMLGLVLLLGATGLETSSLRAQEGEADDAPRSLRDLFEWQDGPGSFVLGNIARIDLPAGYAFLDAKQSRGLMQYYGNFPTDREQGTIVPAEDMNAWFVIFEFDPVGYIKDDEKDEIDADELIESLKEGNEAANEQRREMGVPPLEILGWETPPRFNDETKQLEWCINARSEGGRVLNHQIRVLGRKGVMEVTLVCGPDVLGSALSQTRQLLEGFSYRDGERYADFKSGDKIAKYGLTALIAGGAAVALAKTGLLKKLIKPILIGLAIVGGIFVKFFNKIFRRGS